MAEFRLLPFSAEGDCGTERTITGSIERCNRSLEIIYRISGTSENFLHSNQQPPSRRHELWRSTCLECFLACPNSPEYWEMNISPAGSWNVYQFSDYRQGMQEAFEARQVRIKVSTTPTEQIFQVHWPLPFPVDNSQPLETGISVILSEDGDQLSYWALRHPFDRPDFHHRAGLILKI